MIRHQCRVAFNNRDALDRNAEFFGGHLAHGDAQAGADIHLAGVNGDRAIGMKRKEAVHLMRIKRFADVGS